MKDGQDNSGAARRRRAAGAAAEAAPARQPSSGATAQPAVGAERKPEPTGCEELVASYIHSYVADEMAQLALAQRHESAQRSCDVCEQRIEGEPAGRGLFFWWRDGEPRWDEPILCEECAGSVHASATRRFETDDEEEG